MTISGLPEWHTLSIYPCPADQRFLQEVEMSAEAFTEIVAGCDDDDEIIEKMKAHLEKKSS